MTRGRRIGNVSLFAVALVSFLPRAAWAGDPMTCRLDGYAANGAVRAASTATALNLTWRGEGNQDIAMRLAIVGGKPVIESLTINGQTIAENAAFEYRLTSGLRRMSNQQMQPPPRAEGRNHRRGAREAQVGRVLGRAARSAEARRRATRTPTAARARAPAAILHRPPGSPANRACRAARTKSAERSRATPPTAAR